MNPRFSFQDGRGFIDTSSLYGIFFRYSGLLPGIFPVQQYTHCPGAIRYKHLVHFNGTGKGDFVRDQRFYIDIPVLDQFQKEFSVVFLGPGVFPCRNSGMGAVMCAYDGVTVAAATMNFTA